MKNLLLLFTATLLLFSCDMLNQQSAVDYNDSIIDKMDGIIESMDSLINNLDNENEELVQEKYNEALKTLKQGEVFAKQTGNFKGNANFINAFEKYVEELKNGLKIEYPILIESYKFLNENYSEESYDAYMKVANKFDKRFEDALNEFIEAQDKFSKKYNFIVQ